MGSLVTPESLMVRFFKWSGSLGFLSLILACSAIFALFNTSYGHNLLRQGIEWQANRMINGHLSIGQVDGTPWAYMYLRNVSVTLPDSLGGAEVVGADEVRIDASIMRYLFYGIPVSVLMVDGLRVAYIENVDGKGMDSISALSPHSEAPASPGPAPFRLPFSLPELNVARGQFLYFDPRDSTMLRANNFFIRGSAWRPSHIKAIIGTHSASFVLNGFHDDISTIFTHIEVIGDSVKIRDLTLAATYSPPLAFHVDGTITSIRNRQAALAIQATGNVGSITRLLGVGKPIDGLFSLSASLTNTLVDPDIKAHLESPVFETDIGSFKLAAIDFRYAQDVLTIDRFKGRSQAGELSGQGVLDLTQPVSRYQLKLNAPSLTLENLPPQLIGETFPLAGVGDVSCEVRGEGFDQPPTFGSFEMAVPLLVSTGKRFVDVKSTADYQNGRVRVSVRNPLASVTVNGSIRTNGVADLTVEAIAPNAKAVADLFGYPATGDTTHFNAHIEGVLSRPTVQFSGQVQHLTYATVPLGELELNGALADDQVVRVDVRLDTTRAVLSAEVALTADYPLIGILRTQNLRLNDYLVLDESVGLDALLKIEGELDGTLANPILRGNGLAQNLSLRNTNLGDASIAISLQKQDLSFRIVKPDFTVIADGLVSLTDGYPYDLQVAIKRASLSPALAIIARRPVEQRTGWLSGRIKAKGLVASPELSTIAIALDSLVMTMDDRELHFSAPSTIKLDKQIVTVDHFELEGDIGHVRVNGLASLEPGGLVNMEALFEDVHLDFISPFLLSQGTLDGTLDGLFSLNGSPDAPALTGTLYSADVSYTTDQQVNQLGTISASFLYEDSAIQIPKLILQTPSGTSTGSFRFPLDLRWSRQDTLTLETQYTASLVMENLSVAPLREFIPKMPHGIDGLIHGRIDATGSTTTPEDFTGTVEIDALRLTGLQNEIVNRDPIRIHFNIGYADIDTLNIAIRPIEDPTANRGRISAHGRLAYRMAKNTPVESDFLIQGEQIAMEALLGLADIDIPLSGLLDTRLKVTGLPAEQSVEDRFSVSQVRYNDAVIDSISGRVVYEYSELILHEFYAWIKGSPLVAYGNIPLEPKRGSSETAPLADMAITVEGQDIDLSFLNGILYELENVSGRASVALSVGGTPSAPRSIGDIRIRDAVVQMRDIKPILTAPELRFQVEGNHLSLVPVEFKAGKGKINLSTQLTLDNLSVSNFETIVAMNRAEIEVVGSARLIANGTVSAAGTGKRSVVTNGNTPVTLTGTIIHPINIGTLVLGSGAIIRPSETPVPFWENMGLDVEFDIPGIRIKNDLADAELEGGLAFSGNAQNPIVTGNATVKEGAHIVYVDTRFAVESGRVELTRRFPLESFGALIDDPVLQLDPEMTLSARADRVRDIYGAEYEVRLSLSGRPSDPSLQLTAVPFENGATTGLQTSLTGPEVVSLLTFGLPGITTTGATDAVAGLGDRALKMATGSIAQRGLKLDEFRIEGDLLGGKASSSPAQFTISKRINQRAQVTFTRLFDSSDYKLRVGYQLTNFLFIETFTDQISERPQNGFDLKVKFRFR